MRSSDLRDVRYWTEVRGHTGNLNLPGDIRTRLTHVTGRWTPELSPRLAHFNEPARLGEPVFITVYFSPRDWQGLEISVAKHADGNFRVLGGCSAFETEILKWAESDLRTAPGGDFQRSVETFLYLYSQRNCVEKVRLHCHGASLIVVLRPHRADIEAP